MLSLNFYKVRTGIDIRPLNQGGTPESQSRYEQIIQTISQRAEIEYINNTVFETIEKSPDDLGAYQGNQRKIYVLIFGIDKTRSSWTAHLLNQAFGNMALTAKTKQINPNAEEWIGGLKNNISCSAALFDLKPKKKNKRPSSSES